MASKNTFNPSPKGDFASGGAPRSGVKMYPKGGPAPKSMAFAEGGSVRSLAGGAKMYRSNDKDAVDTRDMADMASKAAKRNSDNSPEYKGIGREALKLAQTAGSMEHDDFMKRNMDK